MNLSFSVATETDAATLAQLHTATNRHLLEKHGLPPPKGPVTEKGVRFQMRNSRLLVARLHDEIVATLNLGKKKPWAIDPAYFTPVRRPLYLTSMAVAPAWQRQNVGRQLLDHALTVARNWPADAIRLDAYDNETGAGGFYAKCGYREAGRTTYRSSPLIYFELLL